MGNTASKKDKASVTSGNLPPFSWNLPIFYEEKYIHRAEEEKLFNAVKNSKNPVTLCGFPGVGTTTLANYLIHKAEYRVKIWLHNNRIEEEYYLLGMDLGFLDKEKLSMTEVQRKVKQWLREQQDALIIIDDVNFKSKNFPPNPKGKMIFVSHSKDEKYKTILLSTLTEDQINLYLQRNLKEGVVIPESIRDYPHTLSSPLSLVQAVSYVNSSTVQMEDYWSDVGSNLPYSGMALGDHWSDYMEAIATTSLNTVLKNCGLKGDHLMYYFMLDYSYIPLSIVRKILEKGVNAKESELETILSELKKYSIIEIDEEKQVVSFRSNIAIALRYQFKSYLTQQLPLINSVFSELLIPNPTTNDDLKVNISLLPHFGKLMKLKSEVDPSLELDKEYLNLIYHYAILLQSLGSPRKAQELLQNRLEKLQQKEKPDTKEIVITLEQLASLYEKTGDTKEKKETLKMLEEFQKTFKKESATKSMEVDVSSDGS